MPRNEPNTGGATGSANATPKKRDRLLDMKRELRPIRFVIADDHVLVRELIVRLLTSDSVPMELSAEVDSADRALDACQSLRPDILLVDLRVLTPAGRVTIAKLREKAPSVRILLYSGSALKKYGNHSCCFAYFKISTCACVVTRLRGERPEPS